MDDIVFIYITNPSREFAKDLARHLVEERFAACANIFPIESVYWWKGELIDEGEYVVIAKTTAANFERTQAEVERIHPYTTPCITKIPVVPNGAYADWLRAEVSGQEPPGSVSGDAAPDEGIMEP
ncbi:MAG: divalent-cation tolerance protein CutA [bacterium]|nr:divalent-cation tolerance protein CutA [bacterium]MDZ4296048.1 divalent-cation tolerance protein CutA [Patescibacteria group bacterium]